VSTASLVQIEARQECLDMDADLPSVSDQSEMDFLLSVSSVTIHTHPFNGPFSGITQVSRYQKDKTNLDFTEARDSEWQWHQLGHMQVCTSLQTDNHAAPHHSVFYRPDARRAGNYYQRLLHGAQQQRMRAVPRCQRM